MIEKSDYKFLIGCNFKCKPRCEDKNPIVAKLEGIDSEGSATLLTDQGEYVYRSIENIDPDVLDFSEIDMVHVRHIVKDVIEMPQGVNLIPKKHSVIFCDKQDNFIKVQIIDDIEVMAVAHVFIFKGYKIEIHDMDGNVFTPINWGKMIMKLLNKGFDVN